MGRGLSVCVTVLALAAPLLIPAGAQAVPGQLTQSSGEDGCVELTGGSEGCVDSAGVEQAVSVAVAPDGRHVYSVGFQIAAFSRDAATNALTPLPGNSACISNDGSGGAIGTTCTDGVEVLPGAEGEVATSPDGRHVYVASRNSDALLAFARDATSGVLTQLPGTNACVSNSGSGGACADGLALDGVRSVTVSPDGLHVYATAEFDETVAAFRRDPTTGALTQLAGASACLEPPAGPLACGEATPLDEPFSIAVAPDGRHVYVAEDGDDALLVLSRDATTGALTQLGGTAGCVSDSGSGGACVDGRALAGARSVRVSPDGATVYVAAFASDAVSIFARDATTGGVSQLSGTSGCVARNFPVMDGCAMGFGLGGAHGVAITPDGLSVYVAGEDGNTVAAFNRDAGTGALTQLTATAGCAAEDPLAGDATTVTCADGRKLLDATGVAVSPDCTGVYVASENDDGLAVFRREAATCPQPATPPTGTTPPPDTTTRRPRASARLRGPRRCVRGPFTIRVRGRQMRSATFFLGDRRIRTLRSRRAARSFRLRINPAGLGFGRQRVRVRVRFTEASGARARTLRLTFRRCPRRVIRPRFTG